MRVHYFLGDKYLSRITVIAMVNKFELFMLFLFLKKTYPDMQLLCFIFKHLLSIFAFCDETQCFIILYHSTTIRIYISIEIYKHYSARISDF